jgi:hypothetical protein
MGFELFVAQSEHDRMLCGRLIKANTATYI